MPADDGWSTVTPSATASAMNASRVGRPQLSVIDILLMLWRAKWIILLVAIPFVLISVALAMTMPKKYSATSRIQVTAGTERVFDPIVGSVQAQVLSQEEITESEIELLQSPVIFDRVIQKIGLENIYPKMHAKMQKAPETEQPLLYEEAVDALRKDFYAGASPKNPVIRTGYKNEDPVVAADVLNTIIETYLEYRADLFSRNSGEFLSGQRLAAEAKLETAEKNIELFLTENRIGDFETEKSAVANRHANVTDELGQVRVQQSDVDARLATTLQQLSMTAPTIDLNRETTHEQQLFDLRMDRARLVAVYQPGTPQVQAIDRKIAEIQRLISEDGDSGARVQRGPNEIYQALDTRRTELEAEAMALRRRAEALQEQKREIENRQLQLTRLEPDYQELLRSRAITEEQVRNLIVRESEERLKQDAARAEYENIQILEPARPPAKGESKRKLIVLAGAVFGLGTGFVFALIWIFTRSTLPTAGSIARTSGLPVLASVRPVK